MQALSAPSQRPTLLTRLRGAAFPAALTAASDRQPRTPSQAFYLSLEHSFLFGACRTLRSSRSVGKLWL